MKTFFAGIVVACMGVSGIANVIDHTMKTIQTHAQQLNAQLEQLNN